MIVPALTGLARALAAAAALATALGLLPLLLLLVGAPVATDGALVPPPPSHPAFHRRAGRWGTAQPLRHPQHRRLDVWEDRVLPPLRPTPANGSAVAHGAVAGHR